MSKPITLEIKYTNKEAIALKDLTNSLNALASEYKIAQKRTYTKFEDDNVELYVTRIREGSVIAELTPFVVAGMGLIENTNALLDFCNNLKLGYDYLLSRSRNAPNVDKKTVENLVKIVEPVVRENGTQVCINAPVNLGEGATLNLVINSGEARVAKEAGKAWIQRLESPSTGTTDRVRLYWYQARNEKASNAGDRAIIPDISEKPVKVIFSTEKIKEQMLVDEVNPFQMAYTVDVVVDFKGKKPKLYRITKIHSVRHK